MNEPNEEQLDSGWDDQDDDGAASADAGETAAGAQDDAGGDAPRAEGSPEGGPEGGEAPRKRRRRKRKPRRAEGAPVPAGETDERAERALEFVLRLLDDMDMDCEAELLERRAEEPNEIQIDIFGPDAGRIIGKKGQVLGAIQYLTNRVVNRPGLDKRYVTVDAEGYRSRRDDTLASMARRLGKQAVTEGKIITFEPMNPRDRRVIHLALAKFEGLVTRSEGEGDERRVQIIPVRR
jgi:spoIIIJ-associated protein